MKKILIIMVSLAFLATVTVVPIPANADSECDIELTNNEFLFYVKQGDQASQNLGIYNRGTSTLMFYLSKNYEQAKEENIHGSYGANGGKMMVDQPYLDLGTVPNVGRMTRTITCTVSGEQYLQVNATPDKSWITCQVRNIEAAVVTVLVTIDLNNLTPGQLYRGNVVLTSNVGMVTVPVLLQIATSSIVDWLDFEPPNGMINAGESTASVVMVDAQGMQPGSYKATIVVTSNDPDESVIEVAVTMIVIAAATPPPVVETFQASPGNNRVHLFWDMVTASQGGVEVVGYNIYRSTYPKGQTSTPITDFFISGMQYTDPNVSNGITYYYIIKSVDKNGNESEASAEVRVTPAHIEPTLNIEDGQVTRTQYFEISGTVEPNSSVVINGQPVPLSPDGSFSHGVMLSNGINPIDVIVVDPIPDPIVNPSPDNTYNLRFNINFAPVTTIVMTVGFTDATINGEYVINAMPVAPTIVNGRSMVPFRFLGESLGAEIGWDADEYKVTYTLEGRVVEMWINQTVAKVNGQAVTVNPPPQIISGSTVVPVRFIIDNLGAEVEWYAATKTILVRYPRS